VLAEVVDVMEVIFGLSVHSDIAKTVTSRVAGDSAHNAG
jgi:hypothetical protein